MTTVDHYAAQFWNDLPAVDRYLRRRSTGDSSQFWMQYIKDRYATPPRKRALMVGCGNGWADRMLCDLGIAEHFDAFDGSPQYLETANQLREGRPISYELFDFNTWIPTRTYDLIVNVAALHHVRYLFRMSYLLSRALEPDGVFVNWDYVGPSRNQYAPRHLAVMRAINTCLPNRFRTNHKMIPEIHECLVGDATEGVHARDIKRALNDFFEPVEEHVLGGGVAYQLLWNNTAEFFKEDEDARVTLDWLIRLDEAFTDYRIVPPLFAFMVYRRRRKPVGFRAVFDRFVREVLREKFADLAGGVYPAEVLRAHPWTKRRYYEEEPQTASNW